MQDFQEDWKKQQELYSNSNEKVRGEKLTEAEASSEYAGYINFVMSSSGRSEGKLLDVGCGNGWSTHYFAKVGFQAIGVDLNPDRFEAPETQNMTLKRGDMLALAFEDESFDFVCANQALEHVPNPERGLLEMLRVLKPGGTIHIVSPNLLSILISWRGATRYAWRNRPIRSIFIRSPEMPRHPAGNTVPECLASFFRHALLLMVKLKAKQAHFTMRKPDLRPPFHADNDASYLCNPVDLVKFFKSHGCEVIEVGLPGRMPFSNLIASGTFVAARKPRT